MEVNNSYIEFLLQLLNKEENINIENYQEELIVNLYLTLLSLSNQEYSEDIDEIEKEKISDFLRRLNNLKVKIQLKRKPEELKKLAEELINQYYENVNILSVYIKDGIEFENTINTMDAKSLTKMIDKVTKEKMGKEDRKGEINHKRLDLVKLFPTSEYYLENDIIYIKNNESYEEITQREFIDMFSYLLNPDNYKKIYPNKSNERSHNLIIANIIKLLIVNDKKQTDIDKVIIPMLLTYITPLNLENKNNLDTSDFNIDNIKISELYSLAAKDPLPNLNGKTTKWRNISIPNEYLLEKIYSMIKRGMYYYQDDTFVLEHIENNASDFKISINIDKMKQFLKILLENNLTDKYSKKSNI